MAEPIGEEIVRDCTEDRVMMCWKLLKEHGV
jgi:hypothetical protein